jgi:hypothetical protein
VLSLRKQLLWFQSCKIIAIYLIIRQGTVKVSNKCVLFLT